MGTNKLVACAVMTLLTGAASGPKDLMVATGGPKDPQVAATEGFFLDGWQPKRFVVAEHKEMERAAFAKASAAGEVTVTVDPGNVITKIPPGEFGHNANPWMGSMIAQPAFMRHLEDLQPHVIRWPAGSGSDGYWWDRAPGDPPADAPKVLLDRDGLKKPAQYFYGRPRGVRAGSLDDYYEARRLTGNEGIITVNYGYARYGTGAHPVETAAHYAADWVRYDHGRTKYWEVGNENYGFWELGYRIDTTQNKDGQPSFLTGQLYAKHFAIFADSMRKAAAETGATIYIGAVTAESEPLIWDSPTRRYWDPEMMKALNGAADFYVVHNYFTAYRKNISAAEILYDAATVPAKQMKFVEASLAAAGAPVKPIAMDEWNMFAAGSMQQVSNISGAFADIVVGEAERCKYGLACRWDLSNAWDGGNDHGLFSAGDEPGIAKWNPRPSFYYLYYMKKMQGDRMVATESQDTIIRAYGSTFTSGEVNVTLVNTGPADRMVKIAGKGWAPRGRYYWYALEGGDDNGEFSRKVIVNGRGPTAIAGGPEDYASIPAWSATAGKEVVVRVPGHGAVCLTVEKR